MENDKLVVRYLEVKKAFLPATLQAVIPAQAGIHGLCFLMIHVHGSRLRGDDDFRNSGI